MPSPPSLGKIEVGRIQCCPGLASGERGEASFSSRSNGVISLATLLAAVSFCLTGACKNPAHTLADRAFHFSRKRLGTCHPPPRKRWRWCCRCGRRPHRQHHLHQKFEVGWGWTARSGKPCLAE